jgi:hypothetical protein
LKNFSAPDARLNFSFEKSGAFELAKRKIASDFLRRSTRKSAGAPARNKYLGFSNQEAPAPRWAGSPHAQLPGLRASEERVGGPLVRPAVRAALGPQPGQLVRPQLSLCRRWTRPLVSRGAAHLAADRGPDRSPDYPP